VDFTQADFLFVSNKEQQAEFFTQKMDKVWCEHHSLLLAGSWPRQSEALLMSGLPWARSRRCAVLATITMAHTHVAAAFASPQDDPFLLLESTLKAVERILRHVGQQPLQRCWIDHPYREEELTRLEEEVIPAISRCLQRNDEIDRAKEQQLEGQQEQALQRPAAGGLDGG
jgi:hypothetical protein